MFKRAAQKVYEYVINPPSDKELKRASELAISAIPVIWLIGKTGAGKSTIVQSLTGNSQAEVGNGFRPCTKTSSAYEYPADQPILRFLDTRGLGEVGYDPEEDIQTLGEQSHAILIVARVRDAEQHYVIEALKQIRKSDAAFHADQILVVHTGASEISDERDRQRAINVNQAQFEKAWGKSLGSCQFDASSNEIGSVSVDELANDLKEKLRAIVPALQLWLQDKSHQDAEQTNYDRLSAQVLSYAGVAAATDAIPLAGLITVPATQGKMLHSLAQQYDVSWDSRMFSEFIGALGVGFGVAYMSSLAARQLVKIIPVFGPFIGGAAAASISFASTYALGRAACYYLYYFKTGKELQPGLLKQVYEKAMSDGKASAKDQREEERDQ